MDQMGGHRPLNRNSGTDLKHVRLAVVERHGHVNQGSFEAVLLIVRIDANNVLFAAVEDQARDVVDHRRMQFFALQSLRFHIGPRTNRVTLPWKLRLRRPGGLISRRPLGLCAFENETLALAAVFTLVFRIGKVWPGLHVVVLQRDLLELLDHGVDRLVVIIHVTEVHPDVVSGLCQRDE